MPTEAPCSFRPILMTIIVSHIQPESLAPADRCSGSNACVAEVTRPTGQLLFSAPTTIQQRRSTPGSMVTVCRHRRLSRMPPMAGRTSAWHILAVWVYAIERQPRVSCRYAVYQLSIQSGGLSSREKRQWFGLDPHCSRRLRFVNGLRRQLAQRCKQERKWKRDVTHIPRDQLPVALLLLSAWS